MGEVAKRVGDVMEVSRQIIEAIRRQLAVIGAGFAGPGHLAVLADERVFVGRRAESVGLQHHGRAGSPARGPIMLLCPDRMGQREIEWRRHPLPPGCRPPRLARSAGGRQQDLTIADAAFRQNPALSKDLDSLSSASRYLFVYGTLAAGATELSASAAMRAGEALAPVAYLSRFSAETRFRLSPRLRPTASPAWSKRQTPRRPAPGLPGRSMRPRSRLIGDSDFMNFMAATEGLASDRRIISASTARSIDFPRRLRPAENYSNARTTFAFSCSWRSSPILNRDSTVSRIG